MFFLRLEGWNPTVGSWHSDSECSQTSKQKVVQTMMSSEVLTFELGVTITVTISFQRLRHAADPSFWVWSVLPESGTHSIGSFPLASAWQPLGVALVERFWRALGVDIQQFLRLL